MVRRQVVAAVARRDNGGYQIRILKSRTVRGDSEKVDYDYFELDPTGLITIAPWGTAKDWKPGRVTDIAEAAERYATPPADAMRINLGGAL